MGRRVGQWRIATRLPREEVRLRCETFGEPSRRHFAARIDEDRSAIGRAWGWMAPGPCMRCRPVLGRRRFVTGYDVNKAMRAAQEEFGAAQYDFSAIKSRQ